MTTPTQYIVGTEINLSVSFTNVTTGEPADPTAVEAYVMLPDGTVENISADVVQDETGEFHAPYTVALGGLYGFRFVGTGDVAAAGESSFSGQTEFPLQD